MYYGYYNNDNIIICSICITIMKTLELGGKGFFFFPFSPKCPVNNSHRKRPVDIKKRKEKKNFSGVFIAYK